MKIKVRYFTTLFELAETEEEEMDMKEGGLLGELIKLVAFKYGEEAFDYLHIKNRGEIDPSIQFLVNGVASRNLRGFKTELREGDVVAIIPPIGGGGVG